MTDNDGYCKSCEKLADEVERLRGCHQLLLMIEATGFLTQGLDSGQTHRAICKKWQRVREALGEKQ